MFHNRYGSNLERTKYYVCYNSSRNLIDSAAIELPQYANFPVYYCNSYAAGANRLHCGNFPDSSCSVVANKGLLEAPSLLFMVLCRTPSSVVHQVCMPERQKTYLSRQPRQPRPAPTPATPASASRARFADRYRHVTSDGNLAPRVSFVTTQEQSRIVRSNFSF